MRNSISSRPPCRNPDVGAAKLVYEPASARWKRVRQLIRVGNVLEAHAVDIELTVVEFSHHHLVPSNRQR